MRKRFFVVGFIVSVLVGGVLGWLWWALGPGSPSSTAELSPVPSLPPLPETEMAAPPPEPSDSSEPSEVSPTVAQGVIDRGRLAVEIRGRHIGTEDYTLERRENGELVLHSQGTLKFKIAFFDVEATFEQLMTFTAQRRPVSYQLALNGPVGIGNRRVSARFGAATGIVNDGERQSEIALPEEPFLLLGMFSSYAVVPLWAQSDGPQKLKVISLRGDRRNQGDIWVVLARVGPVRLRGAQGDALEAEEYLLQSERLTLRVYLSGERLLALHNDTTKSDERFRLYRSDLFADNFKTLP
ncbi:MAG: hypothetical protein N3E42_05745 [Candidatus Bipolaricaulota bacterium]|nr:hypothetical protein [Candidatus Bipolaricaulota bacterium]